MITGGSVPGLSPILVAVSSMKALIKIPLWDFDFASPDVLPTLCSTPHRALGFAGLLRRIQGGGIQSANLAFWFAANALGAPSDLCPPTDSSPSADHANPEEEEHASKHGLHCSRTFASLRRSDTALGDRFVCRAEREI
jgi:hypothetical protein